MKRYLIQKQKSNRKGGIVWRKGNDFDSLDMARRCMMTSKWRKGTYRILDRETGKYYD